MKIWLAAIAVIALSGAALAQPVTTPPPLPPFDPAEAYGPDTPGIAKPRPQARRIADMMSDNYPPGSIRTREEGDVRVELCLDEGGRVRSTKLTGSSSYPRLDEATVKSMPKLRFTPAKLDGEPVDFCGYALIIAWRLPPPPPPPPPQ